MDYTVNLLVRIIEESEGLTKDELVDHIIDIVEMITLNNEEVH